MSEQLKECLPNPTFVDYQVPHDGQGADFYDEKKMLEYGRRIVRECAHVGFSAAYPGKGVDVLIAIKNHFGVE